MLARIPLLKRFAKRDAPARAPVTPRERARLEHRRRKLQRDLRRLQKMGAGGCSTCVQQAPSRGSVQAARLVDNMRVELKAIDARLGERS